MRPSFTLQVLLRSCAFHALVVIWFSAALFFVPVILLVPRRLVKMAFDRTIIWYLRLQTLICQQTYELRGRENLPAGPVLFASKHLSKWDSAVLPVLLGDPAVVLRRGMLRFPVYGNVISRLNHLTVPRSPNPADAAELLNSARKRIAEGRSILIFPEGTRRSTFPFSPPDYKRGVTALYRSLHVPCVPIALNSGVFWPRNSWLRYPGTVIAEILAPIAPGMEPLAFTHELIQQLESNSQRLVREGLAASAAGPT